MIDPEREVLRFAAAHHIVTAEQVAMLPALGDRDPVAILDELLGRGLVVRRRLVGGEVTVHAITPDGLAQIGSDLPSPGVDLTGLRHGLGAGWVWLRAGDGRFEGAEVLSEREQVFRDTQLTGQTTTSGLGPSGLRVPGFASVHAPGLHYPDVLLSYGDGFIAVHMQLVMPSPGWLAALLRAYGADERYLSLVFVVEDERVARAVEAASVSAGVSNVTRVHWMLWT